MLEFFIYTINGVEVKYIVEDGLYQFFIGGQEYHTLTLQQAKKKIIELTVDKEK